MESMEGSTTQPVSKDHSRRYTTLTLPPKIVSGIYLVLTILLQINLMLSIQARWDSFIQTLITLKDLILTCFCYMSFARVMGGDTTLLCAYVEEHISSIKIDQKLISDSKKSIILHRERRFESTDKIVKRYFYLLTIVCGLLPYVQSVKSLIIAILLNKKTKIIFLMNIYYPEEYQSMLTDFIIQTFLLVWYGIFLNYWITDLKAMSLSFQCITTEMELLRDSIEKMDSILEYHLAVDRPRNVELQVFKNIIFQSYISGIVRSHQIICSRMSFFNHNLKNLVVFLMNIYAIQLCLFLIFVIELPDLFSKVRYMLRYSIILSLVFFISVDGEKVTSEGENLRRALWMCSWTDKPNWFKKSLLIMMTRATVDLKIKPFSLYSLDLSCFTQIVKGTYSYFNLYKSLKK